MAQFQNKWLSPDERDKEGKVIYPTFESFHKAYSEAYGRARSYKDIFDLIEGAENEVLRITKLIANGKKESPL